MNDIRVGTCQRDFAGHTGSITDVQLHDMRGDKQLFSSSIDGHVKLWDIRDSTHHVISAVNTWTHPAGVTALCVTYIAGQVRIFATCQDSILYMWTLPAIAMIVDNGWRSKLGKFVNSLPVALFVLACIVVDLTAGLVFEFQPGDAKDCKGRDSLESLAITWAVMLVFCVELGSQMAAHGWRFFWPVDAMNYFDMLVVGLSLGQCRPTGKQSLTMTTG